MRYLLPFLLFLLLAGCNGEPQTETLAAETAVEPPAAEVAAATAATNVSAPASTGSYAGQWAVTVEDTPMGTATGTLELTEADGKLKGLFKTPDGKSLSLKTVNTTKDGMTTSFYFPQYDVDVDIILKGQPSDEVLTGKAMGQFSTTAKRM